MTTLQPIRLDNSGIGGFDSERGAPPQIVAYWHAIRRRKWIIAAIVGLSLIAAIVVTLLMTPIYEATARIQIDRESQRITDVQEIGQVDAGDDQEFYQTQYSLLQARSLAERVARDLGLASNEEFFAMHGEVPAGGASSSLSANLRQDRLDQATRILRDNISILPIRSSSLVDIQYASPDAALSAKVANSWVEQFIASTLDRRFASTQDAREFLEGRLAELRQRLEQSERELVNYAAREGIITLAQSSEETGLSQPERTITSVDLEELNRALVEATDARIAAESALGAQARGRPNSEALARLREERATAAAELSQLTARFESGYPEVQAAQARLASLDQAIADEAGRLRANSRQVLDEAASREAALRSRVDQLKNNFVSEQSASIQYSIFQREVDTNRQLYDALLQRYKEIGASGVGSNNVSVIDMAKVPGAPASPNLLLNLLLSLLLGLFTAVLVVIGLEQIDQSIKEPTDITPRIGLPLLGVIPYAEDDVVNAIADPKSEISEAYLSLQTNLSFITDHGLPRSMIFTSTRPNEGKSNSAVALARSLARTGKRVLIVDADMRNSSIHEILGKENLRGLSNYLVGDEFGPELLTHSGIDSLDLMTAGPQPPNAGELLLSPRLRELMETAAQHYDVTIVDTPPVLGLADVPLVATAAEGVIYTIEMEGSRVRQIEHALGRLRSAKANVFGALATKYDQSEHGYGYGYGYGYGRDESEAA